ncbi:sugar ABC transporter permease [Roseivivax isoporae]|uniref:Xylose transport system permease protein XylH n=1 Tax=Roseivivax isoporae LMG 25204 TaxID=1449351 RepID=X7F7E4_9RHOB|nr:ABC transporter permease [Roseivivax isoporae]ETX28633.1 ABC transporter permease [Roseivivax isoporae LMG 25204]
MSTHSVNPPQPVSLSRRGLRERLGSELSFVPVALGLVALFVFFAAESDVFLTSRNLNNLLVQATVTGIIALGLVFVLLVGEIDLSVAATSGIASVLMAKLVVDADLPIPLAVLSGVLSGVAIGAASGRWITLIGVPSFVVTLGVGLVLNGIQLLLLPNTGRYNLLNTGVERLAATYVSGLAAWLLVLSGIVAIACLRLADLRDRKAEGLPTSLLGSVVTPTALIGGAMIAILLFLEGQRGLPMPVILFALLLGVMAYLAGQTRFGLHLYAIGANAEAARRAGIKVERIKIAAFAIAGGMAAFGGILAASRILGVSVSSGGGVGGGALLLESIAAAVIGGVSLFGGRGRVVGALFGALIIATVSNGLNLMGVANEARLIVTGLLLIVAVSIDRGIEKAASHG